MRQQIDDLIRERTAAFSVHLPILGVTIDMNDLGIISGIVLASLFYVLRASLNRELQNLRQATRRAKQIGNRDNLELLLMAQVLSSPPQEKSRMDQVGFNVVVFLVPCILYFFVCLGDAQTFLTGSLLENTRHLWGDTLLEWTALFLTSILAWLCYQLREQVNMHLGDLQREIEST